jgi:hypothetical protein
MRKKVILQLILILTITNLMVIMPASAISKPSVPDFSLKLIHYSSYQPAVYGLDPYTGENITITLAKHQNSTEIVVNVVNQPFTPYKDSNGNWISLYYGVRSKGHFSSDWSEGTHNAFTDAYNSSYATIMYPTEYYPPNTQVDFQIKAMIGYLKDSGYPEYYHMSPVFVGESSDWSSTQTITIDNDVSTPTSTESPASTASVLPSQGPSATPGAQSDVLLGLDWWQVATVVLSVVVVLLVFVVFYLRKRR